MSLSTIKDENEVMNLKDRPRTLDKPDLREHTLTLINIRDAEVSITGCVVRPRKDGV